LRADFKWTVHGPAPVNVAVPSGKHCADEERGGRTAGCGRHAGDVSKIRRGERRGGRRCILPAGLVPVELGLKTKPRSGSKKACASPSRRRRLGEAQEIGKGTSSVVAKRGFHRHEAGGEAAIR
jgi:hypothetical protein